MQPVSSRIWTSVAVSISYDDNDYSTGTSRHIIIDTLWKGGNTQYPLSYGLNRTPNGQQRYVCHKITPRYCYAIKKEPNPTNPYSEKGVSIL